MDQREKNANWAVRDRTGNIYNQGAHLAVLMDIRDELQSLNSLLRCSNFMGIPHDLRLIRKNTTKRKYERRKVA